MSIIPRGVETDSLVLVGDFQNLEGELLTEDQVQRSFRKLFSSPDFSEGDLDKAEDLLDKLRPESPLRHRLSVELGELRKLVTART